jgi:hypothetical protein
MLDRILELKKKEWNVPLSRRVAQTLLAYDAEAYKTLSVEARGSIVLLSGFAIDEETKTIALEAARSVQGVAEVIDRITLRRNRKAPRPSMLDVPVTTAEESDPLWQRSLTPVALCGLLALIFGWQWIPLGSLRSTKPDNFISVEGSLFIDGQPAAGAELTFYPIASDQALPSRPTAIVGPDGRFSVVTDGEGEGAPAGRYLVTARSSIGDPNSTTKGSVPAEYAHPQTTPLSAEITPADRISLPPFELARATAATGKSS